MKKTLLTLMVACCITFSAKAIQTITMESPKPHVAPCYSGNAYQLGGWGYTFCVNIYCPGRDYLTWCHDYSAFVFPSPGLTTSPTLYNVPADLSLYNTPNPTQDQLAEYNKQKIYCTYEIRTDLTMKLPNNDVLIIKAGFYEVFNKKLAALFSKVDS